MNIDKLAESPGWRILNAVRERRYANTSDAIERTSPRIVSAIAELAKQFHPEAFTNSGTGANTTPTQRPESKTPDGSSANPTQPQAQLEAIDTAGRACAR